MALYSDSEFGVREEIDSAHATQIDRMASPGTWGGGTQRRAVALEARRAGIEARLLEASQHADDTPDIELPDAVRRLISKLAVEPAAIDREFYDDALADGLSEAEYAEIVGVVARMTDLDVFARGIGVELRTLPAAKPGAPTRERIDAAVVEQARVPTVPNFPEGGETAKALFGEAPKPYIVRGLSIVPAELRDHLALEQAQYSKLDKVRDFTYQHHVGLTRPQTEIVAGRISALNECFFWTTSHALFLRESGRKAELDVNPLALVRPEIDSGVPGGVALIAFCDALIGTDRAVLDIARVALSDELGPATVVAAAAVAANFTKNDRIANGLGIPLDPMIMKAAESLRADLGLDSFRSAVNTLRHMA